MSQPPATIGRYQIISRIGRGGMGALYLALDPLLDRQVAIKLLRDDMDELRERFAREARSVAKLRHQNIVTVFDVGEENGQPFIAMEYIHGETLADVIRRDAQLPVWRKLEIVDELCDGLAFAHKAGIVHRDIKPANVMVEHEGGVKILDFGIARIAESGMTMAGVLMGTLNYMSPEQVRGEPVDARSDIFAVGALMYELLSRKQAFPGGLHNGIIHRIMNEPPAPLEALCRGLDPEIVAIVNRALEKDPAARYQDLGAMRRDLQRILQQLETRDDETITIDNGDSETVTIETPRSWRRSQLRRDTQREALERLRQTQVAQHLDAAQRAFEAGDYEAAISSGEQALLLAPDDEKVHDIVDRARAALEERQVRALVEQGEERLEAGALTEAINFAQQALTIAPDWPDAVELLAASERQRLERVRERERLEAVRVATERAQDALEREAYDEALAAASEALALEPAHEAAKTIQRRAQKGLERERELAFHRLAQKTADEAHRLFNEGRHDEAIAALTSFDGEHPHVAKVLDDLRREKAQIDAEKERLAQEERERERQAREREQKIAAGLAQAAAASHESAITILEELLTIDRDRQDVVNAIADRKAALERQREEERLAQERAEKIEAALARAEQTASHEEAVGVLTAALKLDPSRADVRDRLNARQAALDREREEARLARKREQKIAAAIVAAKATASHSEALAHLRQALPLDPQNQEINALIHARQRALDEELEIARKERERQARVAEAIKRAGASTSHDAAIAILTDALRRDPGDPELGAQLEERQAAFERQQQEEKERRERVAAGMQQARNTASHAEAIRLLKELAPLAPQDPALRAMLAARETALAEEQAAERERQERVKALIKQAASTKAHAAAIALLEEVLQLEPEHRDAQRLLTQRQAGLEREQAEATRQSDVEQARRRVAELIAAGQFDAAEATLDDAERRLDARKLLKAERRQLKQARAAASPAGPRQGMPFTPVAGAGLAAAAIVLVATVYFLWPSSQPPSSQVATTESPTTQSATTTVPQEASPTTPPAQEPAAEPSSPPVATPPAPEPTPAPATPAPATPDPAAGVAAKIAAAAQQARDLARRGDVERAVGTITSALRLDPKNGDLRALAGTLVARARDETDRARSQASQLGDNATSSTSYRDAQARVAEATKRERAGQFDQAVRLLQEAAGLFGEAQRIAAAAKATPAPAPPTPTEPATPPPSPPPVAKVEPPTPEPKPEPPPAKPVPAPTTPAAPTPSDQELIAATLREYSAAFSNLDVNGVRRVYPSINVGGLQKGFALLRSQRLEIQIVQVQIKGNTATVRAREQHTITPRVGEGRSDTRNAEFRLQKTDGRWVIVERH